MKLKNDTNILGPVCTGFAIFRVKFLLGHNISLDGR